MIRMFKTRKIKEIQRLAGIKPEPLRRRVARGWWSLIDGIKAIGFFIGLLVWVPYCNLTGRDLKTGRKIK